MQAQRRMTYFDGVRHDCCSRDTNYNIDLPICYQQAAQHPFLTGEPFDGPFKPQPEIPRTVSAYNLVYFGCASYSHFVTLVVGTTRIRQVLLENYCLASQYSNEWVDMSCV
jgi:hypothetical protein